MTLPYPDLIRICRGLGLLLSSGIGTPEGVFLLASEETGRLSDILNSLGRHLDRGIPLAEAMDETGVFPEYVRSMVRIAEETGRLEHTLAGLADHYEEKIHTLRQIRSAVIYPAMVLGLMLLVLGVLLVKVLPVFDRVYASLGTRLTGAAAGLLYAGQLLEWALPVIFALLLVLALAVASVWFCPRLREKAAAFWRRHWGDRGIARKFLNARFVHALAMGSASGLELESNLFLAAQLMKEVPAASMRCAACRQHMEAGASLAEALEKTELMPTAQCRLLQVGIRSGKEETVLQTIASSMLEDAQESLEQSISRIEPAMVLVSSLLVGLILLSVLLPLADILTVLG